MVVLCVKCTIPPIRGKTRNNSHNRAFYIVKSFLSLSYIHGGYTSLVADVSSTVCFVRLDFQEYMTAGTLVLSKKHQRWSSVCVAYYSYKTFLNLYLRTCTTLRSTYIYAGCSGCLSTSAKGTAGMERVIRLTTAWWCQINITSAVKYASSLSLRRHAGPVQPILRALMEYLLISCPASVAIVPLAFIVTNVVTARTLPHLTIIKWLERTGYTALVVVGRWPALTVDVAKE